jgi:excisionase family DNA binding protein
MHEQVTTPSSDLERGPEIDRVRWRRACRDLIMRNALRKRSDGVPTYSVPEAAALLSVSQEHLYRLIRADAFPAVRMRLGQQGRYVVPARAVEALLDAATGSGRLIDVESVTATFAGATGGQR